MYKEKITISDHRRKMANNGNSGWRQKFISLSVYYHNKRQHIALAVIPAKIFMIYVYSQSRTKNRSKNRTSSGQTVMTALY